MNLCIFILNVKIGQLTKRISVLKGNFSKPFFYYTLQECHSQLLRHRNGYFQHVKQIIKAGGPWENPVLQGILKETDLPSKAGRLMTIFNS